MKTKQQPHGKLAVVKDEIRACSAEGTWQGKSNVKPQLELEETRKALK